MKTLPVCLLMSVVLFDHLRAKELEGVYAPVSTPCPTVEEAIKKMTVPEGYEVRNFASEPMIVNPVAMTWDHRGRLWAVELFEYPSGAKQTNDYQKMSTDEDWHPVIKTGEGSPRDRVVVLEDTDNDGKADKRTVFAEGLSLATGILCGYDGVFVGQAPNMFFFRDKDGDDKADEYKTVLTGFGLEDRHELLNSFTWGPDGWMYFTHGVFTNSKVHRPTVAKETGTTLNAGIYRVHFTASEKGPEAIFHEVFADGTSNPWGCDYDAAGNWFVEACVIDHLFHMAPGGLYQRQGGAPENPYAYELLPSIVNHKHFRAAYAGIQVYQGGRYPKDTDGHLFFGNIHDNSIHEEAVEPVGATFKAKPVRDFLRANDGWFRPVSIQTGPDGFLWVMDWCDKYPCYQNAVANPEGVDREKGRIWRIVYNGRGGGPPPNNANKGGEPPPLLGSRMEKDMDFNKMNQEQLVDQLGNTNSWLRRAANRALLEQADSAAKAGLVAVIQGKSSEQHRLAALWTLGSLRSTTTIGGKEVKNWPMLDSKLLDELAKNPSINLRSWVVLLSAGSKLIGAGRSELGSAQPGLNGLAELAADPSPEIRRSVALTLRSYASQFLTTNNDPAAKPPISVNTQRELAALIGASGRAEDKTLPFLIWMALEPQLASKPVYYLPWLSKLAPTAKPLSLVLTYKSARRITDTRSADNMDLLLKFLDDIKSDDSLVAHALDGMLKAQEAGAVKPAKTDPAPFFAAWAKSTNADVRNLGARLATLWGDPNAVAGLMGMMLDEKADKGKRIEAILTVRKLKSDAARAGILKLLGTKASEKLTIETLRAAGELGGMDLASAILKAWGGYVPALKSAAAEVMISRGDWAEKLLDAVEGKWVASQQIPASEIPATARRYYATQPNPDVKARAAKLLGAWNETNADTKALISAKRKASLEGEPNLENGKLIYTTTCAVCHKFHGGGHEVGPELIGSGRSSLDALLNNIIDPNQIIGNGYENVTVTTKDARTLAGRVLEDTPNQVTLLGIGGKREVIARGDISKMENTHQSLMPMGFGGLPDDVFRDLIWYMLAPPEEGPLTPEKKAALAAPVTELVAPKNEEEYPKIDWESVSLWNPDWKVVAPEFEGTPVKLTDFAGRKNILQLHPYPDKKTPSRLVRKVSVPADQPGKIKFSAASNGEFDWELVVKIGDKEVKRETIGPNPRWHEIEISLEPWKGQTVEISLENHANGWAWEFSYWDTVQLK